MHLKKTIQYATVMLLILSCQCTCLLTGCGSGEETFSDGIAYRDETENEPYTGQGFPEQEEAGGSGTAFPATGTDTGSDMSSPEAEEETDQLTEARIGIYVCGAVEMPGVYYLAPDARVCEAVEAAGGFLEEADREWINQAAYLTDGQMIRIYTRKETAMMRDKGVTEGSLPDTGGAVLSETDAADQGKINLNTASTEDLMSLPGIGQAKAEAIISYREQQGGFGAIEEIMQISGIKEAVFSKIKDRITV